MGGADSVVQWWELTSWGTEGSGFSACHLASVQLKGVLAVQPGQQVRVTGAEDGKGGRQHMREGAGSQPGPPLHPGIVAGLLTGKAQAREERGGWGVGPRGARQGTSR